MTEYEKLVQALVVEVDGLKLKHTFDSMKGVYTKCVTIRIAMHRLEIIDFKESDKKRKAFDEEIYSIQNMAGCAKTVLDELEKALNQRQEYKDYSESFVNCIKWVNEILSINDSLKAMSGIDPNKMKQEAALKKEQEKQERRENKVNRKVKKIVKNMKAQANVSDDTIKRATNKMDDILERWKESNKY